MTTKIFFRLTVLALLIFPLLVGVDSVQAQENSITIDEVEYRGLRIWSRSNVDEVLSEQGLQDGRTYPEEKLQKLVNKSIESLQKQGLFSDIKVSRENGTLIFEFEEFNRIANIKFESNSIYDDSKLLDVLLLQTGDPANPFKLQQARQDLVNFYLKNGYSKIDVTKSEKVTSRGRVVVTFRIEEGKQRTVNSVEYHHEPDVSFVEESVRNLYLKLILPMKPGQPFSDQKKQRSIQTIKQWYGTLGHLDASVDVKLWRNIQEDGIDVEFHIEEGPKYYLDKVLVEGNQLYGDTEIISDLPLQKGDVFNTRLFTQGIEKIERKYRDRGYAEASVDFTPRTYPDTDPAKANVSLEISEKQPIYVERIEIHGNFRTYDRVIRREVMLEPGELLDGERKRNSLRRLRNLGYFNEVKLNIDPGSKENWKIVRVRVKEGRTGQFQFGGGFSSSTGFTGNLSVRKDNFSLWDWSSGFTGRGQTLKTSGRVGERQSSFNISWDDPWFNDDLDDTAGPNPDVPLGFGWSIFNSINDRDEGFNEIRQGGALRFSREFGPARSNQFDAEYSVNATEIEDLSKADSEDVSLDLLNEAQNSGDSDGFDRTITTFKMGLQRDRRDNRIFPTEGYYTRFENRLAGEFLGGDVNFYNPELDSRSYIPIWGPTFWAMRFNYKTIDSWDSEDDSNRSPVPSFEKFFLGGNQNVRGYEFRDIAVYDDPCDPSNSSNGTFERCSGGKTSFYTNLEFRYEAMEETMQLFAFTDIGNVYEDAWEISSDFKQSAGIGMRVRSPMGPINISWANRMEPTFEGAEDDGETKIDFNIGSGF